MDRVDRHGVGLRRPFTDGLRLARKLRRQHPDQKQKQQKMPLGTDGRRESHTHSFRPRTPPSMADSFSER